MKKQLYFFTLISVLFFPIAFIISNYIVLGAHLIHDYINGTDTPFIAYENYIYVFSLFFIMILLYVFFLSKIIINISSEIRLLSHLIRRIAKDQNYPEPVESHVLKNSEMKHLGESVNILIDQLKYNQDKYRESEEMRKRYLDQLSHDIKTPLSIIKINLFYLKTQQNVDKAIEEINKNADIISTLSDRIYHKNYLNSDSIITHMSPVSLNDCINAIIEKWNNALSHKKIKFTSNIEANLVWELDRVWFERLFDNILQNVLYHSKASQLTIEGIKENNQEQLIITDDGVGFDLTKQLQQSNQKGLNIINEVPKLLNLHILIESNESGTRIVLTKI
ncbi:sensor histidine kinase YbdK [Bacillus sp. J14TS2]|uniref:sensor histidine kinase n=1 Tax=Bacillus sp. J14TS2 TaxID=2807188 RepID=UPI001B255B83|nr:HAMP domain-containing sensor histidine kinase [Bacillus sp. J14TS2]GIN73315.1 sensor histidine kinase YbdK [Bacillus sp. J14TS2]